MNYSWDPEKSRANKQKHGYTFEKIKCFDWDFAICLQEQIVFGEARELWIGPITSKLATVVIVEKSDEEIRIVSMRCATNTEISIWRKEFQNG